MMMRSLHIARTWLAAVLLVRFVNRRPHFLPWSSSCSSFLSRSSSGFLRELASGSYARRAERALGQAPDAFSSGKLVDAGI